MQNSSAIMFGMKKKVDKPFLIILIILIVTGFFIFNSASLGLLAGNNAKYGNVAFSQVFFGLFLGTLAMIATSRIPSVFWKRYSFVFFVSTIILNLLVFVPHIGFSHGGAHRWIMIAGYTFQPSEFLKIAFIMYFAAWLSQKRNDITSIKDGLLPFLGILSIVAAILISQPDNDTLLVTAVAGFAMFLAGGGKWKHIIVVGLILLIGLAGAAFTRPYVKQRLTTFLNPAANSQTSGYQIQQSLIAIGSGGIGGRGFGQSVQKFNFLPEPIGDSIFAVASEEFGFIGSVSIILLFLVFMSRGLKIAINTPDSFGRLFIVGAVILLVTQAFVNIGAMVGVLPLSGIPLPFISHGGTALLVTLAVMGIILSISRNQKAV